MKLPIFTFFTVLLMSCSENTKNFSSVKVGMDRETVLQVAGEPTKKRDLGIATFWVYENADRTVVFRKDTVYDIITSADARIDSIQNTLENIGDKIEKQAEKAGDKIDSAARDNF